VHSLVTVLLILCNRNGRARSDSSVSVMEREHNGGLTELKVGGDGCEEP
jgi:hypothetical protein